MREPEKVTAFRASNGTLHNNRLLALRADCLEKLDDLALSAVCDGVQAEQATRLLQYRFEQVAAIFAEYNEAVKA